MKKFIFLVSLVAFFACKEDEKPSLLSIDGTYSGSFYRAIPNANSISSEVSLTFEEGKFSGTSSRQKFPAICRGTYQILGKKIIFTNECPWTAEFDWSLILDGTFEFITKDGDLSNLSRKSANYTDIYFLNKSN